MQPKSQRHFMHEGTTYYIDDQASYSCHPCDKDVEQRKGHSESANFDEDDLATPIPQTEGRFTFAGHSSNQLSGNFYNRCADSRSKLPKQTFEFGEDKETGWSWTRANKEGDLPCFTPNDSPVTSPSTSGFVASPGDGGYDSPQDTEEIHENDDELLADDCESVSGASCSHDEGDDDDDTASVASYYDLLGVPEDASPKKLKNAYREQSRINHPDKMTPACTDNCVRQSTQKQQKLNKAIDVLTSTDSRREYDRLLSLNQTNQINFPKTAIVRQLIAFTLDALYHGGHYSVTIQRKFFCSPTMTRNECVVVPFYLPRGSKNGDQISLGEVGTQIHPQGPRGDVFVTVHETVVPTSALIRKENDLIYNCFISLNEAIFGCNVSMREHPGYPKSSVALPAWSAMDPNFCLRVRGKGMPIRREVGCFGDLFVRFIVSQPASQNSSIQ